MHLYRAYNLSIYSDLPLPWLLPAEGKEEHADVVLHKRALGEKALEAATERSAFVGHIEGVLDAFFVEEGRRIHFDPAPGVEAGMLQASLLGPILGILLRQRGLLVLHASSVAINGEAVAFVGESGWGKSTLASVFGDHGYSLLSDDLMAIRLDEEAPEVIPGYPTVKLWPDAVAGLTVDEDELTPLHSASAKQTRQAAAFASRPVPLKRVFLLENRVADNNAIAPLDAQQAFKELLRHTRAIKLLTSSNLTAKHLQQCSSLINCVPVLRLHRKRSIAALSDVVHLVEEQVADDRTVQEAA